MTREEFDKILRPNIIPPDGIGYEEVLDSAWAIFEPKLKKLDKRLDIELNILKKLLLYGISSEDLCYIMRQCRALFSIASNDSSDEKERICLNRKTSIGK